MKTTIIEFNKQNSINLNKEMEIHQVFDELDKTNYECCYITRTEEKIKQVILKKERLINLEDKYYLCVR